MPVSGPFASKHSIGSVAEKAEESGFSVVYVHDHIHRDEEAHTYHTIGIHKPEAGTTPFMYESISSLSYVAAITHSVELGIAAISLPLRNPIILAKELATLDNLCDGRLVVGIGVGSESDRHEMSILQVPFEERGRIADEYIEVMREIWQDKPRSSFRGKYIRFDDLSAYPKPTRKIPLWIGGNSRAAMRRAAKYGDGWIPALVTPSELKSGMETILDWAKNDFHRQTTDYCFQSTGQTRMAENREAALKEARRTIEAQHVFAKDHKLERGVEELFDRAMLGTANDIIKCIEPFVEAGANHAEQLFIYHSIPDLLGQIEGFGKEVIPSFNRS